jgi:hypothetical protein
MVWIVNRREAVVKYEKGLTIGDMECCVARKYSRFETLVSLQRLQFRALARLCFLNDANKLPEDFTEVLRCLRLIGKEPDCIGKYPASMRLRGLRLALSLRAGRAEGSDTH